MQLIFYSVFYLQTAFGGDHNGNKPIISVLRGLFSVIPVILIHPLAIIVCFMYLRVSSILYDSFKWQYILFTYLPSWTRMWKWICNLCIYPRWKIVLQLTIFHKKVSTPRLMEGNGHFIKIGHMVGGEWKILGRGLRFMGGGYPWELVIFRKQNNNRHMHT